MRLDKYLLEQKLVATRSQGESYVRMGKVSVNGSIATKSGMQISTSDKVKLLVKNQYVSRAGHKLASVAQIFSLDFYNAIVLDVGSSTGGFTDYALQNGAQKVYAVDVGTNQLHSSLQQNPKIELHEKTDIRDFVQGFTESINIVVIDVSFISLREILPSVTKVCGPKTIIAAMVKPQFEAGSSAKHKGVIKNDRMRRDILKEFEQWATNSFVILDKADSQVSGSKGNTERFYKLKVNR